MYSYMNVKLFLRHGLWFGDRYYACTPEMITDVAAKVWHPAVAGHSEAEPCRVTQERRRQESVVERVRAHTLSAVYKHIHVHAFNIMQNKVGTYACLQQTSCEMHCVAVNNTHTANQQISF